MNMVKMAFNFLFVSTVCVFEIRDMYHGIGPLDPERLHVFRTVREITGEAASPLQNPMKKSVSLQTLCVFVQAPRVESNG